ncbi:MAG: selenium metabolism-associated LysR family transcriptional regulator [Desulfovermiculus sp.]
MDMRRLGTFCAVFEQGSFSRAGEILHMSQPTISSHIASLEKELGCALFDRLTRRILPTQAGHTLYTHAQVMMNARRKAEAEISMLNNCIAGRLFLGGSTIPAHYILPRIMGQFYVKHPQVQMRLEVGDSTSIIEAVLSGDVEIGVVGAREESFGLTYYEVARDELVLVAGFDNKKILSMVNNQPLQDWPWIVRESGSGTRKAMAESFENMQIPWEDLNIMACVSTTQAVLACIRSGLGVSMVSSLAAENPLQRKEITQLPDQVTPLHRRFYAIVNSQREQYPATKAFLSYMGIDGHCTHPKSRRDR